jgi:hypothetical protein
MKGHAYKLSKRRTAKQLGTKWCWRKNIKCTRNSKRESAT